VTDFEKIKENTLLQMENVYPKIKSNDDGISALLKTIVQISVDSAIETLKEYELQNSLHQK
jgi:hypothetical protein